MASRSPPLHSSQNRRTSSRGVSLISETLLARSLLDRSRLLLGCGCLLLDRHLLRRPSRSGGGKSAVGRVSTARPRVGFRRRLRLLRLLRRRLLLRRGGFLLAAAFFAGSDVAWAMPRRSHRASSSSSSTPAGP